MRNLQIQLIIIDGQAIHWEVVSGRAVGVQKYTKIIPNRKAPHSSEIITEFSIQRDDETELSMTMKNVIQVRDGQYVSAVFGYAENSCRRCWLVFVNHDSQRWDWVNTPHSFFASLGIVIFRPLWWRMRFIIVPIVSLLGGFIISKYPNPTWILGMIISGMLIGIVTISLLMILDWRTQTQQVRSAWKILQPEMIERISQLKY